MGFDEALVFVAAMAGEDSADDEALAGERIAQRRIGGDGGLELQTGGAQTLYGPAVGLY